MLATLILSLSMFGGFASSSSAQGIAIDCANFTPAPASSGTPVASPAADADQVVPFPAAGGDIMVFAAASLTASFDAIKAAIEADNPAIKITNNHAGSQVLVTQLTERAEADVFASASNAQMKAAQEAGVIDGSPTVFTQNRLAVVVPKDNPAGVQSYADLAKDGIKLVLALPDVPVGQYARQSICKAAGDAATYGDSFVEGVAANAVSEEDNVKSVLTKVVLGEADAGIVYTTDVTAEAAESVLIIDVPKDVNVIAKYPIAPVTGGDTELAAAFISFVIGPDGQQILQDNGFEPGP